MARVLIIGYGNTLRGDDAVGQLVADRLRERISDPGIEILALHQLAPELMEPIARAERVIFIDAAEGSSAGEIATRPVEPDSGVRVFTHHATPSALLAGARALYGVAPPATLITVTAATFELGADLSQPVARALEAVIESIVGDCQT